MRPRHDSAGVAMLHLRFSWPMLQLHTFLRCRCNVGRRGLRSCLEASLSYQSVLAARLQRSAHAALAEDPFSPLTTRTTTTRSEWPRPHFR